MSENAGENKFTYQKAFVTWMTALNESEGRESMLAHFVQSDHHYRLETYQSSYLGRITKNLSDTLFDPCQNLFGPDFVLQVLASFFKAHPPHSCALTSAADNLPQFVRRHFATQDGFLFADVAEICILRWKILITADPLENSLPADHSLADLYLRPNSNLVWPSTPCDLAGCWIGAQQQHFEAPAQQLFQKTTGVILSKSSPTDFHVISVPEELYVFASALIDGESVDGAVQHLQEKITNHATKTVSALDAENAADSFHDNFEPTIPDIPSLLQNFLHVLSSLNLLRHGPRNQHP